jgi:chromosome partitioning protein
VSAPPAQGVHLALPFMPDVAVVNRKGGSGKSTLSTHIAAYCSTRGIPVMLGDVDRQQSTAAWLRLRRKQSLPESHAPIVGWNVDPKNVMRAPAGVSHVVLDTPGGMQGFDLARVAMFADAIIMPVCNSVFDRESAAECFAELRSLPRVASGRCAVAAIGMRLDARTKAGEVLREWAAAQQLNFIGVLRETQNYVKAVENGLTLFDMPRDKVETDLAQWEPILNWLAPVLHSAPQRAAAKFDEADAEKTRPAIRTMVKPVAGATPAVAPAPAPAVVRPAPVVSKPVVTARTAVSTPQRTAPVATHKKPSPASAMKARPSFGERLARLFGLGDEASAS